MRGRMCLAALLAFASGCDFVFRLEPASLPRDGDVATLDDAPDDGGGSDASGPTAYIAAGDYDGDGLQNPIDPCPLDPTTETTDGDADGLPDACDPNVNGTTTKDCIVLLETFSSGALDSRWKSTPAWTLGTCSDGDTGYCSTTNSSYTYFDQPYSVARVTMEVRLRSATGATVGAGFDMFATLSPPTSGTVPQGTSCGRIREAVINEIQIRSNLATSTTVASGGGAGAFANQQEHTLTWTPASGSSSTSTCHFVGVTVDATTTVPITDPGRFVGLAVRGLGLNVHYVIAYGSTCPQ